jgi:hypothetical protein
MLRLNEHLGYVTGQTSITVYFHCDLIPRHQAPFTCLVTGSHLADGPAWAHDTGSAAARQP